MKMNSDRCHLIRSSNDKYEKIELNGEVINNAQVRKLGGAQFDTHIENLSKKVRKKLHALTQVIKYISTKQTQMGKFYNIAIKILSTHLDML